MAVLQAHVSFRVLDALGVIASLPIPFTQDDTVTLADLATFVNTLAPLVDGVTDAEIVGIDIVLTDPLPGGLKTAPVAGSEVERVGLFNFSQNAIKYKYGIPIPALKQTLIVNGRINLAASAVTAFVAGVTGAIGANVWTSTAYNELLGLVDALISFRKHRRAETRRSFEV